MIFIDGRANALRRSHLRRSGAAGAKKNPQGCEDSALRYSWANLCRTSGLRNPVEELVPRTCKRQEPGAAVVEA